MFPGRESGSHDRPCMCFLQEQCMICYNIETKLKNVQSFMKHMSGWIIVERRPRDR